MSTSKTSSAMSSGTRSGAPFLQVTFSDQSMTMMNSLPVTEQLQVMDIIGAIRPDQLSSAGDDIGHFSRGGKNYYRVRAGEFRCYFEIQENTLYSHYICHKNTLTDFIFRFKLPVTEETMVEQHKSFWKYLESVTKND
ncbi:MAG: cytotoxic translational repressor of toxin-antitoxin stability system [Verrucomicrobiota bacterium]|nr:cytotoxic translational repressor of toxin-antitoxin stability system [Verrucomicrobiota bacterium]